MKKSKILLQLFMVQAFINQILGQFSPLTFFKLAIQNITSRHLLEQGSLESLGCAQALKIIMSDDNYLEEQTRIFVTSGMQANDLGLFDSCLDNDKLKYATVIVKQNSSVNLNSKREVKFGICLPKQCNSTEKLQFLNNIYIELIKNSGLMSDPEAPLYGFPQDLKFEQWRNIEWTFYFGISVMACLILLSVAGQIVGTTSLGDKVNTKHSLVEAVDEDNPDQVLIEKRKKSWALFLYSFSLSRNFEEIFTRSYKTIKDRKFDVFDGLRVFMMSWIILGHIYSLGKEYGQVSQLLKSNALNSFLAQIIVSADVPVSFFFFMSGFIGMFGLIKKFQHSNELAQVLQKEAVRNSGISAQDTSYTVPRLSKRALIRQIFGRWIRLAIPFYMTLGFALSIMPVLQHGPLYSMYNDEHLQLELYNYWWAYLTMTNNIFPYREIQGLYWMYFVANLIQFYIIVMIPSIYYYQRKKCRSYVIVYLLFLILVSISYLGGMTYIYEFSSMMTVDEENMYDELFRFPLGPVGYYALGILLAIFYFEHSQSVSNEELRNYTASRFMRHVGATKKRTLGYQMLGSFLSIFVVFIRYSCFAFVDDKELSPQAVDMGRWPIWLNALFNAFAHYIFIIGVVLLFLPIFIGKLSLLRDIFGAPFFRPFSRTNFTLACAQGVFLLFIYFSQQQMLLFEHKNFLFLFCGVLINGYIITLGLSLFFEWPFRTMGKVLFSAPQRVMLRLKGDLAKQLNTQNLGKEDLHDPYSDAIVLDSNHTSVDIATTLSQPQRKQTSRFRVSSSGDYHYDLSRDSQETTSHISGLTDNATVMVRLSKQNFLSPKASQEKKKVEFKKDKEQ